jgi:hypothetical protein
LWQGRPKQGAIIGPFEVIRSLAALYFIYPAVLLVPKLFVGSNWMFSPLLIVLLAIAYSVSIGSILRDKRRRAATRYELTPERVVVRRKPSLFVDAETSIAIDRIGTISLQEHADGTGTVYLFNEHSSPRGRQWKPPFWKYLPPNSGMREFGMAVVLERLIDFEQVRQLTEAERSRHHSGIDAVILGQQKMTVY